MTTEQMVEEWLRAYLGKRFLVCASKIDPSHQLKHWGVAGEAALAELVGDLNRTCRSREDWRHVEVAPPDILSQLPETVEALIAALAKAIPANLRPILADLTEEVPFPRNDKGITEWLIFFETGNKSPDSPTANVFKNIDGLAQAFATQFKPAGLPDATLLEKYMSKPTSTFKLTGKYLRKYLQ